LIIVVTLALFFAFSYQGEQLYRLSLACLFLLFGAGLVLWRGHENDIKIPLSAIALSLTVFWAWLALTLFWNPVQGSGLVYFAWFSIFPFAFWLYALASPGERNWFWLFRISQLAAVVLAVWALTQLFAGGDSPRSVFLDVNSHAAFLGLVALPVAAQFLNQAGDAGPWRWLTAAVLFLLVLAIAITGSRGVMVSAAVALLPLIWIAWRHATRRALVQMLLVLAAGFAIGNLFAKGYAVSRIATLSDPVSAGEGRFQIWQGAWSLIRESPWLGHGLGNFVYLYPARRHPDDGSAGFMVHNDYLQFWLEAGLPSVLLLLVLFAACAWYFVRGTGDSRRRIEAAGVFGGLLLVALHSALNFNFYLAATLLLAGLWLGRLHELTVPESIGTLVLSPARVVRRSVHRLLVVLMLAIPAAWLAAIGSAYLAYQQAHAHAAQGRFLAAHETFSLAERLFPEMDIAYYAHADLYRHMLKTLPASNRADREALFRGAQESLAESERLNPYRPHVFWVRGDLYVTAGELAGNDWAARAEAEYRKALTLNPRFFAARENYARLLLHLGRIKDAHAVLEAGLREWHMPHPVLVPYLSLAAQVREQQGDRAGAGKLREQVAAIRAEARHRARAPGPAAVLAVPKSAPDQGKN
jgi:O-antigen ligase